MAGGPRVGGEQWTVTKIFYWASPPIGAHSRPFIAHDCPSQCSFGRLAENVLDKVAGEVCVSFEWCNSSDWTVANQALTIREVQKVVQKWFPLFNHGWGLNSRPREEEGDPRIHTNPHESGPGGEIPGRFEQKQTKSVNH